MLSNETLPVYLKTLSANFIKLQPFIVCSSVVQKLLPLLENQIKESHQRATEELRQCRDNLPSNEAYKMFFLIEVKITGDPV